jgi:hypothetical protein
MGFMLCSEIYKKISSISKHATHYMVYSKAFDIITWQSSPPSRWYPLLNTWDVMMNSVVLSPGNLHQYPVLSCGKHLYDFHITNGGRFGSIKQIYSLHLQVPVPSQESGWSYTMYNMCVTGNQFKLYDLSILLEFFWGGIFLLSYYFLRKKNSTIMLEPKQFINHHIFCFFLTEWLRQQHPDMNQTT